MTPSVLETTRPEHIELASDPVTAHPATPAGHTAAVDWWQLLSALPATDEDELPLFGRLVA